MRGVIGMGACAAPSLNNPDHHPWRTMAADGAATEEEQQLLRRQVLALRAELEASSEAAFDAAAVRATVEAELVDQRRQSERRERALAEQLRRAQQEANLARSQLHQHQQQQQLLQQQQRQQQQQQQRIPQAHPPEPPTQSVVSPVESCPRQQRPHHRRREDESSSEAAPLAESRIPRERTVIRGASSSCPDVLRRHVRRLCHPLITDDSSSELEIALTLMQAFVRACAVEEENEENDRSAQNLLEALYRSTQWMCPETLHFITTAAAAAQESNYSGSVHRTKKERKTSLRIVGGEQKGEVERSTLKAAARSMLHPLLGMYEDEEELLLLEPSPLQRVLCRQFFDALCQTILRNGASAAVPVGLSTVACVVLDAFLKRSRSGAAATTTTTGPLNTAWIRAAQQKWKVASRTLLLHANDDNMSSSSKATPPPPPPPHRLAAGALDDSGGSENTAVAAPSSSAAAEDVVKWMAVVLHVLTTVWKYSSSSDRRQLWGSSGYPLAANVTGSVSDVLEHVLSIPGTRVTTPPDHRGALFLECIAWLTAVVQQPQDPGFRWVLTRQATSRSTAEQWHRAPSAVAVVVSVLHSIAVRQHERDHLPACAGERERLTPLRDQAVRFLHAVLQIVQEERRQWERSDSGPKKKSNNRPVTFLQILQEECLVCQYTAAASLLLTAVGVKVHPDIRSMLQLQMEEIEMDQEEQDVTVMDTTS